MLATRMACDLPIERSGSDFRERTIHQYQPCAAAVEFDRTAFGTVYVRLAVTKHAAPRLDDAGNCHGVRRSAGGNGEDAHVMLEYFRERRIEAPRPRVLAITSRRLVVRCRQGREDFRRNRRRVVGQKVHRSGPVEQTVFALAMDGHRSRDAIDYRCLLLRHQCLL